MLKLETECGFMGGLLHDIGELLYLERCVRQGGLTPALMADPALGPRIKDRLFRYHTEVGAAACQVWKIPIDVVEATARHHNYRADGEYHQVANLVAAADLLADQVGLTDTPCQVNPQDSVFVDLGLTTEQFTACAAELQKALISLVR
jgi:HD-like signal output (HDOD) protein